MALTIRERAAAPALAQIFAIEPALLQTKAAQAARQRGILLAKQQALRAAEGLLAWGHALTWAIVFISAIHIWETVAAIAPTSVGTLHLPAAVYHGAALAFTLMIDACALYIAKANATAAFVGGPANRWTIFFYATTMLLNASFVARHAPAIDATVQAQLLPLLAGSFVLLLPLSIPAGIVAVEASNRTLEAARLSLLIEVETLRGIVVQGAGHDVPTLTHSAPPLAMGASPPAEPILGGKPTRFTLTAVIATLRDADGPLRPQELRTRLGCGESTIHRLLQEGLTAGTITRTEPGAYQLQAHD